MTLKKKGHFYYIASSFVCHFIAIGEFKLKLQSVETLNSGQNRRFFCPMWPWNLTDDLDNTIGYLFSATSSFVHYFVAIGEFKLDLQSGKAQFGSKSKIFLAVCPLHLTDDLEKQ